jgi:DNA-binding transcriptional regulator GbsR (MarR family)
MQGNLEVDEKLFCETAKFYGELFALPPLASKIYSYLIFDFERKGIAFDEFVQVFCASKSSVSTNLALLQNAQLVIDINRIDERKRYFYANENYKKIRFDKIMQRMHTELKLMDDLKDFRNRIQKKDDEHDGKTDVYQSLLKKSIINIQELINKL